MIAAITPAAKSTKTVPRNNTITAQQVKEITRIPMKFWNSGESQLQLVYNMLPDFTGSLQNSFLHIVWNVSWPLRFPRPGWSGTMQAVTKGNHPGKSQIIFLPMIDLEPTDMNCIFSTLHFISDLAHRYHLNPVITFDQPLWWKSRMILASEPVDSHISCHPLSFYWTGSVWKTSWTLKPGVGN